MEEGEADCRSNKYSPFPRLPLQKHGVDHVRLGKWQLIMLYRSTAEALIRISSCAFDKESEEGSWTDGMRVTLPIHCEGQMTSELGPIQDMQEEGCSTGIDD
jgi:hypothetical protein